jgi:hypothetical protein
MFQLFYLDIVKVDLRCFICCNDNIRIFQVYVQSVLVVSDTCFKCFHLDVAYIALDTHVSSVCFHVFQMFQTYVAKVDLYVAYVAMAIHSCFKSIFQMFHLF